MKVLSIFAFCVLSSSCIAAHPNKRSLAFRAVKKCAKDSGLDYNSVSNYFKGDFSIEAKEAKCFLKCVAHELGFWTNEQPQKEVIMQFVDLLVKDTEGVSDIIDECIANDVSDDFCDHLHNVYKCFWSQAMDKSDQKTKHDDFHLETVNENELEEIKA